MKTSLPLRIFFFLFVTGLSFLASGLYLNINFYQNKIYPRTTIDSFDVSGLTISQAIESLENNEQNIEPHDLVIAVDDIQVASSSTELGSFKNYSESVNTAYTITRSNSKIKTIINLAKSFFTNRNISSKTWYDDEKLDELIANLNNDVSIEGEDPDISLKISGNENSIVVFKGIPGREVDAENTKEEIKKEIEVDQSRENNNNFTINAVVASTSAVLSDEQIDSELSRAKKLIGKTLKLKAENKRYQFDDRELISFLKPLGEYKEENLDALILEWSNEVDRESQGAEFIYDENTLEVESFKPHKDGLEVDKDATKKIILGWIENQLGAEDETEDGGEVGEVGDGQAGSNQTTSDQSTSDSDKNEVEIPLNKTSPEITLESTNNLGIKERIGFGESYYAHSIINRVHNVGITAERISLSIVPPGEDFSFNKTLGEVSARTGYRSAYVISGGKTVLGDGGGVCQVSSTLFRAILDAGLKVTKRLQHSYRVSYYELNSQPGFDATVYAGDVDFRFTNDTENHILIYSYVESDNRYMNIEIYGTSDGRTTEVSNYKKWGFRGAPAPEYFPTAELATGVTKQIDWAVSGIKTEFTHTIKDKWGNVTNEETYYSNYRPWSAKYMVGI